MDLSEYIKLNFETKKAFADRMCVTPQRVNIWVNNMDIKVIDDALYSRLRTLNTKLNTEQVDTGSK